MSFVDVGVQWFQDAVDQLVEWFSQGVADGYEDLSESLFGTPTPRTDDSFVFGTPTSEPWTQLHDSLVGGEIMLLSLLLLVICVQGRHAVRIFNFGSGYEARKSRMTAWTGAFLIITWYWVAVLALFLVDGFTIALLPQVDTLGIAMASFLDVSITNPGLAVILAAIGGFSMWALQALLFIREILLYVYLYGMPIGLAIAFVNLPVLSRIAKSISMKFIPLAVMPVPVAVLFRGYELLFSEGTSAALAPDSAFLSYLVAISLPVLSVLIVWKLFQYAAPLTSRFIGTVGGAALTAGAVATAGSLAGPIAATTAARWGPAAAAAQGVAQRAGSLGGNGQSERADTSLSGPTADRQSNTTQNNIARDADNGGVPAYRRAENDPGYY